MTLYVRNCKKVSNKQMYDTFIKYFCDGDEELFWDEYIISKPFNQTVDDFMSKFPRGKNIKKNETMLKELYNACYAYKASMSYVYQTIQPSQSLGDILTEIMR